MEDSSVFELITALCRTICHENDTAHPVDPETLRVCRSRAFEILLQKSQHTIKKFDYISDPLKELEFHQFDMIMQAKSSYQKQQYEEFDRCLEIALQEPYFMSDSGQAILVLLVTLKNSKPSNAYTSLLETYPFGIFSTLSCCNNSNPYITITPEMYYLPKQLTELFNKTDLMKRSNPYMPTFLTPTQMERRGSNDISNIFSSSVFSTVDNFQSPTHNVKSLKTIFTINQEPFSAVIQNETGINKENILTPKKNFSRSTLSSLSDLRSVTYTYNWENLGHNIVLKEPPFASEHESILHLIAFQKQTQHMEFKAKIVSAHQFLQDVKLLSVGIRSESFYYDGNYIFQMEDNLTIKDVSPITISGLVQKFLDCGTCYKRLQLMTTRNPFTFKLIFDGFVFKALCTSIDKFLNTIRRFVILHEDRSLLQFSARISRLVEQITTLAKILKIHPTVDGDGKPPTGSKLLGYLYREITQVTRRDISLLLKSILKQCSHVYFKHFQKWIYHGILEDTCKELFVLYVDQYRSDTKYFFDKAYYTQKTSVPGFLQGYDQDILLCGKYTMLLKSFKPTHPLFSIEAPSISVCLSFDQIKKLKADCESYRAKAYSVCGLPITVKSIYQQRQEKQIMFQKFVARKHRENLELWKSQQEARAIEINHEKQQRLLHLQQQMQEIEDKKLAQKKANLEYEMKMIQYEKELEEKELAKERADRLKRIEFYKELNILAESKKEKADWQVRRLRNKLKRAKLLATEEESFGKELHEDTLKNNENELESCIDEEEENFLSERVGETDFKNSEMAMSQGSDCFKTPEEGTSTDILVCNENYAKEIDTATIELKKSSSDYFNANEIMDQYHKNKIKILGSNISELMKEDTDKQSIEVITKEVVVDLTEAQKNKQKILGHEYNYNNCDNAAKVLLVNDNEEIILTDAQKNKLKIMSHEFNVEIPNSNSDSKENGDLQKELSACQRNKLKVMSHEFGIDVKMEDELSQHITEETMTELQKNRRRILFRDFNEDNSTVDDSKKSLTLDLDRVKNKKKILESEYNIITGECITTPMSTTSDTPISEINIPDVANFQHEDQLNANISKSQNHLRLDTNIANTSMSHSDSILDTCLVQETPESALNTAGVMKRHGFAFPDKTLESTIPEELMVEMSAIGKDEIFLQFMETMMKKQNNFFPIHREMKTNDQIDEDCTLTTNELRMLNVTTLTHFLQMSIVIPLNAHMEIVNNEILKMYLEDLDILGHFRSLRHYFFLMDGEFGSYVCDGLIRKLEIGARPTELFNYQTLHSILENALCSSIMGNDKNTPLLSFTVSSVPDKFDLLSPDALGGLSLSYKVTWPMNLILSPETIQQYASIFQYLIKVRRISWVLEESFQDLKSSVREFGQQLLRCPQYRYVQMIRHKLSHFVHALQNHITSNALQASWKHFKDDLEAATSMSDLYKKHTSYIKRIRFLCMLNRHSLEFHNKIEDIFKIVLRFYRHLKVKKWRQRSTDEPFFHPKFDKLKRDEEDFEKLIKYVVYLGNKIVRHGYQAEIGEFINLININGYYDNTKY